MTRLEIQNHIAGFQATLASIDRELNAPVLDGTPCVFALPQEGRPVAHWLLYGNLYPDQITPETRAPYQGFRLQRTFTLCGCSCFDPRKAEVYLVDVRVKFPTAVVLHKRDFLRSEREQIVNAINHFETVLRSL